MPVLLLGSKRVRFLVRLPRTWFRKNSESVRWAALALARSKAASSGVTLKVIVGIVIR